MTAQEEEESEEAAMLQQAFQQFMISGGGSGTKKKKRGTTPQKTKATQTSPSTATSEKSSSTKHQEERQASHILFLKKRAAENKYWQIIHAFRGTLQRDWIDVDDHLGDVISSISSLRSRIILEHKYLMRLLEEQQQDNNTSFATKGWSECGNHRGSSNKQSSVDYGGLSKDDVELVLDHDLKQHEKMMSGARMLLASMSEGQGALGRRLEELMLHDMETTTEQLSVDSTAGSSTTTQSSSFETAMDMVNSMNDVFSMLALELYRKQCLVQSLLDTVTDDLLLHHHHDSNREEVSSTSSDSWLDSGNSKSSPRKVAAMCLREWPRESRNSCIDAKLLQEILELRRASS